MKKFFAILLSCILVLGLSACKVKEEEPASDGIDYRNIDEVTAFLTSLPNEVGPETKGIVVNAPERVYNEDLWDAFLKETSEGKPAQVVIAAHDMYGNVIYTLLYFDGENYTTTSDWSRNEYREDDFIRTYTAKHVYDITWDEEEGGETFNYRSIFITDGEYEEVTPDIRFDFDHEQVAVWGRGPEGHV